jgi:adenylosuccinate synthase
MTIHKTPALFYSGTVIEGKTVSATAVIGGQYGDEGKGKFVHYLVHEQKIGIIGRGNGGCNAGHNVYDPERGVALALHLMPSGIFGKDTVNIVGCGTVINPHNFVQEMDDVEAAGVTLTPQNLMLSSRAHITLQSHRVIDGATDKVGSTAQGIGPTYRDKAIRTGLRLEVFTRPNWQATIKTLFETHNIELSATGHDELTLDIDQEMARLELSVARIKPYIADTVSFLHTASSAGKDIMLEGAQATMLDINHGTYPFVTSSSATAGGVALGLGLPPTVVKRVVGVFKLPMTRVGKGPFTTRLTDEEDDIHDKLAGIKGTKGSEFGATTGRARDIGWMDLVMAKYANTVNGFTDIGLTKLDMLSGIPKLKVCTSYKLDGKEITQMPADTENIARCAPVYTELDGWTEDISGVADFSKLPENAQKYVKFIENFISVPVTMIGTGPDNADMIIR